MPRHIETGTTDRAQLEGAFFELQRERIGLTEAIMKLRGETARRRPLPVLRVLIALLRLQRANRKAAAALGPDA